MCSRTRFLEKNTLFAKQYKLQPSDISYNYKSN